MKVLAPISIGELYDKISILEIKSEKISDVKKLENINNELYFLRELLNEDATSELLFLELKEVNKTLWEIEDDIRLCEKVGDFGEKFIGLARNVYITNDKRFEIKNKINAKYSSLIVEEKSYAKY
jgi:hypothetical protein